VERSGDHANRGDARAQKDPDDAEPELGPGSMLFLRVVSVLVVATVVYFLIDAVLG
jgi:hypothetical protein